MLTWKDGEFIIRKQVYTPGSVRTTKENGEPLKKPVKIKAKTEFKEIKRKRRSSVRHHGFTDRQIQRAKHE